jgi:hypothetical protein
MRKFYYALMIVSCYSENRDPASAGEEVGRKLKGSDYILLFVNYTLNIPQIVKSIRETSGSIVFGCSSSYGLSDNRAVKCGICALGISSRDLVGGFGVTRLEKEIGATLAESALKDISSKREKLTPIFARYGAIVSNMPEKLAVSQPYFYLFDFSDPFSMSDEALIEGIKSVISPTVPLVGADSFGDAKAWKGYQILNDVYSNSAVLGVFATTKSVGLASRSSFALRERTPYVVTKAEGYTIYEINYRPVLEVYSEITGLSKEKLKEERIIAYTVGAEFPFVVFDAEGRALMKYPVIVNGDGSVVFGTKVYVGSILFAARNDRKKILQDAGDAVSEALKSVKTPQALIVFDCWQRLAAMGTDFAEEMETIIRAAGSVPLIGSYTMGEHYATGSFHGYQNGSIVVIAAGES